MDTRFEKLLVFWLKIENQMLKKRKTAIDTKTEKLNFLGANTEKRTLKMAETVKPKIPTLPSSSYLT